MTDRKQGRTLGAAVLLGCLLAGDIFGCTEAKTAARQILGLLAKGDVPRSAQIFSGIPAAQQVCPSAVLVQGRIAAARGDVAAALAAFTRYVELAPSDPVGRLDLAQAQMLSGRADQARVNAVQAAEATREPNLLVAAGQMLEAAGAWSEAERALRKAADLAPDNPEVVFQQGVFYDARQQHRKAEAAFRKVLETSPGNAQAWDYLGLSLMPQGRYEEAEQAFQSGLRNNRRPNFDAFLPYNYARLLAQLNRLEEASELLDQAVDLVPVSRAVLYERAKLLARLNRLPAARADAEAALDARDRAEAVLDSQIYYLLVRICKRQKDDASAARYAELAKNAPPARNTRGR